MVNITKHMTDYERHQMKRASTILFIIWCIFLAIGISSILVYSFCYRIELGSIHSLLLCIFCYGFIVAIPLMLIHICYAVYVIEKRLLIDSNYEDLIKNLFNIQKYKESINDVLGIFPFLWFCELFSSTCLRLTYFAINKQNDPIFYNYLLQSLTEYI